MENASKALIIAGAILLSILIISLGIMVYNNAKNTVGSANLSKQEIQTFNSQFENYEGSNKTASEIRTMYQAVIASNASETKSGISRLISISGAATSNCGNASTTYVASNKPTSTPTVPNTNTYEVKLGYSDDGLVVDIAWGK